MTKNADFKRLVRARMEKTGESYAAARNAILKSADAPEAVHASTISNHFAPGAGTENELGGHLRDLSITVDGRVLIVALGKDPVFRIVVPLTAIVSAGTVDSRSADNALGAHGRRGKWLVNSTSQNLVRLLLNAAIEAEVNVRAAVGAAGAKPPRWLRPLLRDRRPRVSELTVSVNDSKDFLDALAKTP